MSTKNKKNSKNYSKKNKSINLKNVQVSYYSKKFKSTMLLPQTQILNYIFTNYNQYLNVKQERESIKSNALTLDDCFIINQNEFPVGIKKNTINLKLNMNPKTSLDKLIAYCFYIKQPAFFKTTITNFTELLKNQIGKDVSRGDRTINGKEYNSSYYGSNSKNNYQITDLFYQNIIDYMFKINKSINLDIVNKFGLLSCQNVYGLITDLLTIKLIDILSPETSTVFRSDKNIKITISKTNFSMEFIFKSQLIISRNGEPMDPEYPCGNLEFSFYVDLRKNKYELRKLFIEYDINKCGPTTELTNVETNNQNLNKDDNNYDYVKPEYIIPAGLATAGIITTPFILGYLGGKDKYKYNKNKNKTRKIRRYNK